MAATERLLAALLVAALIPLPVRADEASGTTTGSVSLRGNYWWEQSTRVVAPEIAVELETPGGTRLQSTYLLDAITSASVAAGALTDVRFTERRHDAQLGASHELHLSDDLQYRVGGLVRVSREPDYTSLSITNTNEFSFDERNTILRLNLAYAHDEVRQLFRAGNQIRPGAVPFDEDFDAVTLSLGVERVLRPDVVVVGGVDLTYVTGFLASPYRQITMQGVLVPERHPDQRMRATVWGRVQWAIPASGTAFHLLYKSYVDSWHIGAISPEVRVYQAFGESFVLRLRYRYYAQSAAFFYENVTGTYETNQRFATADPKTSQFHAHEGGIQGVMRLGFLRGTALDAVSETEIDIVFDWVRRTNRFGDGVLAQVGLRVPFR